MTTDQIRALAPQERIDRAVEICTRFLPKAYSDRLILRQDNHLTYTPTEIALDEKLLAEEEVWREALTPSEAEQVELRVSRSCFDLSRHRGSS